MHHHHSNRIAERRKSMKKEQRPREKNTSKISNLFALPLKLPILLLILDGCDFNHFEWQQWHCALSASSRDYPLFHSLPLALFWSFSLLNEISNKFTPISIFQWMHIRFVSSFIGWLNDFVHKLNVIFFLLFVVINSLIYNYAALQNIHKNILPLLTE